jgi:hypothetical protein
MTAFFTELGGQRLTACKLQVSQRGAWRAECEFEAAPAFTGRTTLKLGALQLSGTIVAQFDGAFGERRRCMVVGGAGAWGAPVSARAYHNDAGVKAILVAQDVAREVGEVLGDFTPETDRIGANYVRDANEPASRVLEDVIGSALWWVDFEGVTQVGERPTPAPLLADSYKVQAFDPRTKIVQVNLDDPSLLSIGHTLTGPALPAPQTVREYTVQVDAAGVRVSAWCGGSSRSAGRLAELVARVATRSTEAPLLGLYRYRVVNMAAGPEGRVSLQAVNRAIGLPDIEPISQWPGVAGVHADLTPGVEVLVSFIEGDRSQPIVTHYAGKDGSAYVPVELVIGGEPASPAARQGDTVEVLLPPTALFSGTVGGSPATGVITFPINYALGSIQTGSGKVRIG